MFKYVVSDGVRNNVATYRSARGSARRSSIRPNETVTVFFGTGDRVAGRQLTDRGWVSFPRSYPRDQHHCESFLDVSRRFSIEQQAVIDSLSATGRR